MLFPPFLLQIWIYGNSLEAFLVAVINPNKQALEVWAKENDVTRDFDSLCEDSRAKDYILEELTKVAKEKKVLYDCFKLLCSYALFFICYVEEIICRALGF